MIKKFNEFMNESHSNVSNKKKKVINLKIKRN